MNKIIKTKKEIKKHQIEIGAVADGIVGFETIQKNIERFKGKMTKEEAINNLESLYNEIYNEDSDGYIYAEAIDMAIEVLHDVIESQNNIIKKPRTVRYKLHKPIEYVSIEFDEEEVITHIEHYNEVVCCKDCRFNKHPLNDLCLIKKAGIYPDDDDFCSYGERREP